MHQGKYVFSQVMDTVVRYQFNQCVNRYNGEQRVKQLTCWEQFLALAFGQLSFRKSLRDIIVCLGAHYEKLYHLGFRSLVKRSTLADANERRDWRIYRDFANLLIAETRKLHVHGELSTLEITEAIYVIDSTTIELCLSLFSWARVQIKQAAIKLNISLELHGNIPSFFSFSSGKTADVSFLDQLEFEEKAYYIFDRGYLDFKRFYEINSAKAFFITRTKINWSFRRLYSKQINKQTDVCCDQIVVRGRQHRVETYPAQLRRIKYYDALTKRYYVFVTNNFSLPAEVVAKLYKQRWQVELFFKWLKQHLSIESFWGRSPNAVKTQICIAISVYLLIAVLKKRLRIKRNNYEILQILSVSLFDKIPITKLISKTKPQILSMPSQKQAQLLEF
ncbi:MAG: IS4 family transposase [Patescibacteria group bacterium]